MSKRWAVRWVRGREALLVTQWVRRVVEATRRERKAVSATQRGREIVEVTRRDVKMANLLSVTAVSLRPPPPSHHPKRQ
jgi:hypothetical protein